MRKKIFYAGMVGVILSAFMVLSIVGCENGTQDVNVKSYPTAKANQPKDDLVVEILDITTRTPPIGDPMVDYHRNNYYVATWSAAKDGINYTLYAREVVSNGDNKEDLDTIYKLSQKDYYYDSWGYYMPQSRGTITKTFVPNSNLYQKPNFNVNDSPRVDKWSALVDAQIVEAWDDDAVSSTTGYKWVQLAGISLFFKPGREYRFGVSTNGDGNFQEDSDIVWAKGTTRVPTL